MSAFIRLGLMVLLETGIVKMFIMEDAHCEIQIMKYFELMICFLPCKLSL